jgi:hypothetical protein
MCTWGEQVLKTWTLLQAIEKLPLVQTPEVFGLHANADIQYYTNATRDLWRTLTELQPRTAGGGLGISREEFIGNVAKDVFAKTPDKFDLPVIAKTFSSPSPTQVVLLQELARWNQYATQTTALFLQGHKDMHRDANHHKPSLTVIAMQCHVMNNSLASM